MGISACFRLAAPVHHLQFRAALADREPAAEMRVRCAARSVAFQAQGFLTGVLGKCEAAFIMRGGMDQRATIRAAAEGLVQVTIRGRTGHVRLRNLSVGGCLIEMNDPDCQEGDEIVISLIDGVQVCGRLVWKVQGLAGVAFEERIHQVLIDHLKVKPLRAQVDHWIPRDRFGRTLGSR